MKAVGHIHKCAQLECNTVELDILIKAVATLEFDANDPAFHRSDDFRRKILNELNQVAAALK